MPVIWTFRHYVGAGRISDVKEAYDSGSKQLQARFLSRVKALASLPVAEWNENYRKALKGPCSGLEELRFIADNVQLRPLGFRSGETEFTILFWATEKGGRFVPLSACEQALSRKAEVEADRNKSDALWLPLE